jgi:CRISPR/Cas system-associated protein Cas10 (large subunit of type III CRISPR-Cas system)
MEKRNYSEQQKENQKKFKKTELKKIKDPCAVCDEELYLDGEYTQRIGLINERDDVTGWMCPHCRSEYNTDGKIINLSGKSNISGEA